MGLEPVEIDLDDLVVVLPGVRQHLAVGDQVIAELLGGGGDVRALRGA